MNHLKNKLDAMMDDTTEHEKRMKVQVQKKLATTTETKRRWHIPIIGVACIAIITLLLFTSTTSRDEIEQASITDVAKPLTSSAVNNMDISTIYKNYQLSTIDTNILAQLPELTHLTSLQYVETDTFTLPNKHGTYQSVIEHMPDLDNADAFYTKGSIVRIMDENVQQVNNTYYTLVGSPGDTVEITDNQVFVNGTLWHSDLLTAYNEQGIILRDVSKQIVKNYQYFLINRFPTPQTPQIAYIADLRLIFGKVVGTISSNNNHSLFLTSPLISKMDDLLQVTASTNYGPEAYLDYYLFSLLKERTSIATLLSSENVRKQFLQHDKWYLFFSFAVFRTVEYVSPTEAYIVYKIPGTIEKRFLMTKYPNSTVWQIDTVPH